MRDRRSKTLIPRSIVGMERRPQRSHRPKTAPPFTAAFAPPLQRMEKSMNRHGNGACASFRRQAFVLELYRLKSVLSLQIRDYCLEKTGISSPQRAIFGKHKKSARTFCSKPASPRHGPELCVDIVDGRDRVASGGAFAIGTTVADQGPGAAL
jgi:hypothetical protein